MINIMFGVKRQFALLAACVCAMAGFAVPQEVAGYLADFSREMRQAGVRFAAATNKLPQQYAKDLAGMQQRYQADGALDEFLAVKKEIERFKKVFETPADPFEEIPEMPEDALVEEPEALRALQDRYVSSRREIDGALKADTEACSDKLVDRISAIQKELTKKGKIDEAIEIRAISEKVKAAIDDGTIMSLVESGLTGAQAAEGKSDEEEGGPEATVASDDDSPAERKVRNPSAPWRKWKFVSEMAFSPDLPRLFSPDIASPVAARVLDKAGFAAFSAASGSQPQQVGGTLCQWVGCALVWNASAENLQADVKISSKKLSPRMDKGPQLLFYVFSDGRQVAHLPVPLMQAECTIRIVKDTTKVGHYALFWPKAGISKQFDINPEKPVKIIVGAALSGVREACDTTIQFE